MAETNAGGNVAMPVGSSPKREATIQSASPSPESPDGNDITASLNACSASSFDPKLLLILLNRLPIACSNSTPIACLLASPLLYAVLLKSDPMGSSGLMGDGRFVD